MSVVNISSFNESENFLNILKLCDLLFLSYPRNNLSCLYISDTSVVRIAWQRKNTSPSAIWMQGRVPIPVNLKDYFITIQGVYTSNVSVPVGGIGIDDITFTESNCACKDFF